MVLMDRIMQLKQQGLQDAGIIPVLRQEGYSPKEIQEAFSQSEIKYAINPQDEEETQFVEPGMRPSIMQPQEEQRAIQPIPEQQNQDYSYYQEYQPTQPQGTVDIETITEITQQIIDEKLKDIMKAMSTLLRTKEENELEAKRINSRLERIENNFNQLQMAVIGKIGEYGKNIELISKEMHATQDSFSKILDPLVDNIRELEKITGKDVSRPKPKLQDSKENSSNQ